jgi:hypothetical protein
VSLAPFAVDTTFWQERIRRILPLAFAGIWPEPGRYYWVHWRRFGLAAVIALLPVALAILRVIRGLPASARATWYVAWCGYASGLDVLAITCAWTTCYLFNRWQQDIIDLFEPSKFGPAAEFIDRHICGRSQRWAALVGGMGAVVLLRLCDASVIVRHRLYVDAISYFAAAVAGALVGSCIFCIAVGAIFIRRFVRVENLRLLWVAPARTPGIERLARLFNWAAVLAAVGGSACLAPSLFLAEVDHPPGTLLTAKVAALVITVCVTTIVATVPHAQVSSVIREARADAIRTLGQRLPRRGTLEAADLPLLAEIAQLLETVASSPATTFDDRTKVAVVVAVVATGLPTLVTLIVR